MSDDNPNPFLAQVLAAPEDDAPRLIYADWLEEAGDPRGEFIRVQCELASLSSLDPRYHQARYRSRQLMTEHGEQWAGELKQDVRKIAFHRGFIDNITLRARAFLSEHEALFQSVPVNWMRFIYVKGAGQGLADCEGLTKVRRLDLSNLQIPNEDLVAIFRSPHLNSLQSLDMRNFQASHDQSVGKAIAEMQSADCLEQLSLNGSIGTEEFFVALTSGDGFTALKELNCSSMYGSDTSVPTIGGWHFPSLENLTLRCSLKLDDCEALKTLPLSQIKKLDLMFSGIPATGLERIADEGCLDHVRELSLAHSRIGRKALNCLLTGERLSHCEKLDLRGLKLSSANAQTESLDRLARHPSLTKLTELSIGGTGDTCLAPIFRSAFASTLKILELQDATLSVDSVRALIESGVSDRIEKLTLSSFIVDSSAIEILTEAHFPALVSLNFSSGYEQHDNRIRDADLRQFVSSDAFPNLRELSFEHTGSPKTVEALANSRHLSSLRRVCVKNITLKSDDARKLLTSENLPNLLELDVKGSLRRDRSKRLIKEFPDRLTV